MIVMKFGGSSLASVEKIENAARLIARQKGEGSQVVVVVSAQGDFTDRLKDQAAQIDPQPSRREMDVLLAAGEQISMSLMAMMLHRLGCDAVSLCGWQAGVETDCRHGSARILQINTHRVRREAARGRVVIVAGFQGVDENGDITTIGRGGSDTTAVALAAALEADCCMIFTDVGGVYSADPRAVPGTVKHKEIRYDEMLELASMGAQVLHNRAVEMAKQKNVPLLVLSSFEKGEGTRVTAQIEENKTVTAVASDGEVAYVTVKGAGILKTPRILGALADRQIPMDMLWQKDGELSFTMPLEEQDRVLDALGGIREQVGITDIQVDGGVAKISVVGVGIAGNPKVACDMMSALEEEGIGVTAASVSEIRASVIVREEHRRRAVQRVHETFFVS